MEGIYKIGELLRIVFTFAKEHALMIIGSSTIGIVLLVVFCGAFREFLKHVGNDVLKVLDFIRYIIGRLVYAVFIIPMKWVNLETGFTEIIRKLTGFTPKNPKVNRKSSSSSSKSTN